MKNYLTKKIFVVDDDQFIATFLMQTLNNLGYSNIECYTSGEDCIANIHHNPELIFLDYNMENMNGLEVLQEVKNYYPGIEVIFTTSLEDLDIAVQSLTNGCADFLLKKNINEAEVERILNQINVVNL
jgi:DNA-binding NtrC family response regulator